MKTRRYMNTTMIALVALVVGGLIGGALRAPKNGPAAPAAARKAMYYQDSMHPWIKSDQPGKCTVCGMDLTPIYDGQVAQSISDNLVSLSSNSITVLDVQT